MFFLAIAVFMIIGFQRGWLGHGRVSRGERQYIAELQQVVADQSAHIEALEERVARLEEGLDFAERMLAERAASGV
jgi:cell division protein FtsB